jgi:hypothetical protein
MACSAFIIGTGGTQALSGTGADFAARAEIPRLRKLRSG